MIYEKEIQELQAKIELLPVCEERDDLIKQREVLKWVRDSKHIDRRGSVIRYGEPSGGTVQD